MKRILFVLLSFALSSAHARSLRWLMPHAFIEASSTDSVSYAEQVATEAFDTLDAIRSNALNANDTALVQLVNTMSSDLNAEFSNFENTAIELYEGAEDLVDQLQGVTSEARENVETFVQDTQQILALVSAKANNDNVSVV